MEDYLKGYEYSEIRRRIDHSDEFIDRYIRDFLRVIYMTNRDEDLLKGSRMKIDRRGNLYNPQLDKNLATVLCNRSNR